jgi:poly-gamma-glutamate capsule biosynthesis protein CapA/YwtB (metallophosphatase superfamily)
VRPRESRIFPALALAVAALPACDAFDFGRVLGKPSPSAAASAAASASPPPSAEPKVEKPDQLVVVAGGDVSLGGNAKSWLAADKDYDLLAGLRPVLEGTHLRLASLVSPISDKPQSAGKLAAPIGPPKAADSLARAGMTLVSVAGPELWTSGAGPFTDTLANLARAHVATAGASEAGGAGIVATELDVQGWKIAAFAVATWPEKDATLAEGRKHAALADPEALARAIRDARPKHDLVLVSHHGGPEYGEAPSADQIALARAALDAGADAVFDHHAHVPYGVGFVAGKPVFYGLGNLVAEEDPKNPWTGRSFVAKVTFPAHGQPTVDVCPFFIVDSEPKLLAGTGRPLEEGIFRRALLRLSEPVGGIELGEPDLHSCMRLSPKGAVTDSNEPK